jgi:hypothetical protein
MDFVLQKQTLLAAAASNVNVINGDQFEFVAVDSLLDFGFSANVIGVTIDIFLTSRTVARGLVPHVVTPAVPPIVPDHYPMRKIEAYAHDRIVINASQPGGATTLTWAVVFHT